MELKTFPWLYQRTNTGAIQQWRISSGACEEPENAGCGYFEVTYGQINGKQQVSRDVVRKGKSLGKKNATTAIEQAAAEAEAKWTKKLNREGYVEDLERAKRGERDQEGVAPMLAEVVDEINPDKLSYPADEQIKFNGNRVITRRQGGEPRLFSRKQKEITSVPHIGVAWKLALDGFPEDIDLDGEGYKHGVSLQKISGFFRSNTPKPGHEELGHFVYDVASHDGTWEERRDYLDRLFFGTIFPNLERATGRKAEVVCTVEYRGETVAAIYGIHPLYLVKSFRIDSLEEGWTLADQFARLKYEGGIMRQLLARYERDRRSGVLAKLKRYKDAEFKIVGITEGRGKFLGKAVLQLVTAGGAGFDCVAPGDMKEKARLFAEGDKLIGKHLTVRFFELSDDGTPLQPTPIAIRDYEG
jgi:ATP-dependent DNA ligase